MRSRPKAQRLGSKPELWGVRSRPKARIVWDQHPSSVLPKFPLPALHPEGSRGRQWWWPFLFNLRLLLALSPFLHSSPKTGCAELRAVKPSEELGRPKCQQSSETLGCSVWSQRVSDNGRQGFANQIFEWSCFYRTMAGKEPRLCSASVFV